MEFWLESLVAIVLVIGGVFLLIGSIGLVRLPDIYTRLHGPTKATTLGIAGLLLASSVVSSFAEGSISIHEWLITLFLLITAPVSANMIAKTALHHGLPAIERTKGQELMEQANRQAPPTGMTTSLESDAKDKQP
ncbi:Na+/H+ antiporter subunit G [Oceanospirillum maris]|uniref:Na+/H+ antiporter subunit G n=1 Tax=Oceanospirillum maris TaxID=64977 RepID=UPI000428914A|nr:Na+/H+ antiporter subunit G [Oceanospirillum maris]